MSTSSEKDKLEHQRLELERQLLELEKSKLLNEVNAAKQKEQQTLVNKEHNLSEAPKKLKKLLIWTILEVVFLVVSIAFLVLAIVLPLINNFDDVFGIFIASVAICVLTGIVAAVFEILTIVFIFINDYGNDEINEKRLMWGLLTLFIGFIIPFIFIASTKKILKRSQA